MKSWSDPAELGVHLHRHGVEPLQDGIDHLVEVKSLILLHALLEHATFEKLLYGELVHDLNELRESNVVEPVSVEPDLCGIFTIEVEDSGELFTIGLGVFEHLRVCEALAGLRAVGRVADASGKVANQENDVMAVKLEPAQDT